MKVFCATLVFSFFLLLTAPATSQTVTTPRSHWADWSFLLGEWKGGDGGGQPGALTSATASFSLDLAGQVIVRRNHSEYASVDGNPPVVHDDLMNIYEEGGAVRAIYWDTESHVIHYTVTISADKKRIIFMSDPAPGPRFRLTYEDVKPRTVKVAFEIAAPNKPEEFKMYVQGTMVRP